MSAAVVAGAVPPPSPPGAPASNYQGGPSTVLQGSALGQVLHSAEAGGFPPQQPQQPPQGHQPVHPHSEGIPVRQGPQSPIQAAEEAFQQPLAPPPDPNRPTMSPAEAREMPSNPVPPHVEQESNTGVAMEQAIRGLEESFSRWRKTYRIYNQIQECITGKRIPPVVHWPVEGDDGQLDYNEIDLNAALPQGVPEEERMKMLTRMLGPLNNYLVNEFKRLWAKMFMFSAQGMRHLNPDQAMREAENLLMADPNRIAALWGRLNQKQAYD